jgi:hypothetical protein
MEDLSSATDTGGFEMTLFFITNIYISSISLSCESRTLLLIDYRSMVLASEIECVDIFWIDGLQFWDISLDELALSIELL